MVKYNNWFERGTGEHCQSTKRLGNLSADNYPLTLNPAIIFPSEEVAQMAETEKFTLKSEDVVKKIKELIKEGNIRRIRLIHDGKTIFDIPVTVGAGLAAVGILWSPVLAAIGAFAALVSDVTIEVDKTGENKK
jgi:hypothetical protein